MPTELSRSEIDRVMNLDPEELMGNPADIDLVIAYHRRNRTLPASPRKRAGGAPEGPKKTLADLGLATPTTEVKRRKLV